MPDTEIATASAPNSLDGFTEIGKNPKEYLERTLSGLNRYPLDVLNEGVIAQHLFGAKVTIPSKVPGKLRKHGIAEVAFYNKTVTLTRLGQLKPTFEGNTTGISIFLASFAGGELIAYVQVKMLVNGLDIPMAP